MNFEEEIFTKLTKPNRRSTTAPKTGLHWCKSCDCCLVSDGQKCPVCKNIQGKSKRLKK